MLFALVDCANFYASCERVFDPSLARKPVVILSNNDGCIIARSDEAKALGVPMGAPYFQWKTRLERWGVVVYSSNYALYADMSRRVMETLETFTPDVEPYSIDEAFLAFPGFPAHPDDALRLRLDAFAEEIYRRVLRWTGVPTRVALAPTKTLAKVGCEHAKRLVRAGRTPAFCLAGRPDLDRILAATPVGDVWGVGWRLRPFLERNGVRTSLDLRDSDDAWVRRHLRVTGLRMVHELRGTSCLPMERLPQPRHTLVRSRSFGQAVTDPDWLREAVASHVERAGEKLRAERLAAGALTVFVTTKGHGPGPHLHAAHGVPLIPATNRTPSLLRAARDAFERCYRAASADGRPYRYKKAGVICAELAPARPAQGHLFVPDEPGMDALLEAVDRLNARMGTRAVFFARAGTTQPWQMQCDRRSAPFTTSWRGLPTARAD
ncbi:MAG TPA: Y-family DNA polymerase [Rubricoccaceae bacterium]|nr:Y-family DNA polymerase [Rubricoccaceae bacterium]